MSKSGIVSIATTGAEDAANISYDHKSQPLTISKPICDALKPYLPPPRHEQQREISVQEQHGNASHTKTTSISIVGKGGDNNDTFVKTDNDRKSTDDIQTFFPSTSRSKPYVTLTYASSLDSTIAAAPNTRTFLSGAESKALTHYLRSRHDAILIGVGTAIADDPGLNCRVSSTWAESREELDDNNENKSALPLCQSHQPRPVIIDPSARYRLTRDSKIYKLAKDGLGKGPWIFCSNGPVKKDMMDVLAECGGEYVFHALDSVATSDTESQKRRTSWEKIIRKLGERGIRSVMIEGGGRVINELLEQEMTSSVFESHDGNMSGNGGRKKSLVDAIVVTIAPLYLGVGGVLVCPERPMTNTSASMRLRYKLEEKDDEKLHENEDRKYKQQQQASLRRHGLRLKEVRWIPMDEDAVMCGLLNLTAT